MLSLPEREFSKSDQRELLALARSAITAELTGQPPAPRQPEPSCFALQRGAFVTVHVDGDLRGCIGVIEGREALRETIAHCAMTAAFRDSRFRSLGQSELGGLRIEISVLSELFPVEPQAIQIGKHGLLISAAHKQGLLLPQVAVEHGLDAQQFLEETCRKAGLPPDAWKSSETRLLGFTCEIFSEQDSLEP
jgi:AmmeMemoRadiSam system protein A